MLVISNLQAHFMLHAIGMFYKHSFMHSLESKIFSNLNGHIIPNVINNKVLITMSYCPCKKGLLNGDFLFFFCDDNLDFFQSSTLGVLKLKTKC